MNYWALFYLVFIYVSHATAGSVEITKIINELKREKLSSILKKSFGADPFFTPCQTDIAQVINGTFANAEDLLLFSGLRLYDECQDLPNAHYCLLTYNLPEGESTFPVNTGLCLPLNCTNSDITSLIKTVLTEFNYTLNFTVNFASKEFEKPDASAIVVFTFLSLLVTLAIIGGVLEYWFSNRKKSKAEDEDPLLKPNGEKGSINDVDVHEENHPIYVKILLAFSPITNFKKLLVPTSVPHLASLNGLRTLSMFWVIMGHSAYWGTFTTGYDNPIHVRYVLLQKWISQIMLNAPYCVDAFFYMSGFLVAYLSAKERLNLGLYYFHRFWRLTPPYFIALVILWKCMPYFGRGPFWYQVDSYVSRTACDHYWWANLLCILSFISLVTPTDINNFLPRDYDVTCMGWSWYLANDMQLYIITPLFIFLYFRFRIIGWGVLILFSLGSLAANLGISIYNDFTPYVPAQQINDAYLSLVYSKFYTRGIAWLIGIGAGWVLFEHEKKDEKNRKIPVYIIIIGYVLAGFLMAAPVFGTQDLYEKQGNWSKTERMFYLTFGRFSFTLGLAIMMHFLYTGYGFVINSFLSFGLWDILARLTYSAYLYHPILIGIAYFNSTQYFHYSAIDVAIRFIAFLVLAFFTAMLSFLLVERPMMNLEKVLLPGHGGDHKRPPKSNGTINK